MTAPWTPERALAMFKDWNDPDLTIREFCEKWYVAYHPDEFARIAIEALESAKAEIERQRARADKAEGDLAKAQTELAIERQKQQQPEQCGAWGFCTLPVGHNMGRADIPENHKRPVSVPSDEEIGEAIDKVGGGYDYNLRVALRLLARRIGVRL